jgi:hypothetical protein
MEVTTALRMDLSRQQEDECTNLAQQFIFLQNFAKMFKKLLGYDHFMVSFEIF